MSGHVSDLVLDEVLAGDLGPPHLESCEACQRRLARLRAHSAQVQVHPHFARIRARVLAEAEARQARPASRWLSGWLLVPTLASLALVGLFHERMRSPSTAEGQTVSALASGLREKGSPAAEILRLEDGAVNPVLREGDEVALRLRSGGRRYALVVSRDEKGQVEALWPWGAVSSGELAAEQPAPVFQVTRGDFVVHAFYSDAPLRLDAVRDWLTSYVPGCLESPDTAACQVPAGLEAAHAAVVLQVEARR